MKADAFQALLHELREKHNVVGVTAGILEDSAVRSCASGWLNTATRVECTPESVFQIGSISKVFTANLIMQLVDEGRLRIDDPVIRYLPDFKVADGEVTRNVTVRHLLNHTSGLDGDFFPTDDPEGPSTASYVRKMCLLTNLYPPGQGPVTYSNSGYAVVGRIVEVLTGRVWEDAVMERLCQPLGMSEVFARPHESLRYRCAMGHVADPQDANKRVPADKTFLPLSMSSVGSVLTMSTESLLRFARAHIGDGEHDGVRILSLESARRMREKEAPVPALSRYGVTHWGLGWMLRDNSDVPMCGHDGGTVGHYSYLRVFPKQKIAITALTNSQSDKLFRELEAALMQSLLGTAVPADPPAEAFTLEAERYVGQYRNVAATYTVRHEGGELRLDYDSPGATIPEFHAMLSPYRRHVFEVKGSNTSFDGGRVMFLEDDAGGRARFIRMGLRMGRRSG